MKQKVALALGSGGARGMAHIGVIQELIASGFEISSIAGTSIGAMVGGFYAAGILDPFCEKVSTMTKRDFWHYIDLTINSGGFIKGDRIFDTIRKDFTGDVAIGDLGILFTAVATELRTSTLHTIEEGSLFKAIRASISVPDVLTPTEVDGRRLVDGAVLCPIPIKQVKRQRGDMLIAVSLSGQGPDVIPQVKKSAVEQKELTSFKEKLFRFFTFQKPGISVEYFQTIALTIELMQRELSRLNLELHPPDMLIEIPTHLATPWEFYKANELVEAGRQEARKAIKLWRTTSRK